MQGTGFKGRRARRIAVATVAVAGAIGLLAASAGADVKIRQVHPLAGTNPASADWVELQFSGSGQSVANRRVITYYSGPSEDTNFLIPSNPANTQSQRTVLIADAGVFHGVDPDFDTAELDLPAQDGAVCLTENNPPTNTPIDCVTYGTFLGSIPSAGAEAPTVPSDTTLERKITPNCPTALDDADDTNTGSDFALSTNEPRSNSAAPTESVCPSANNPAPSTKIDKGPKTKVKTRKKKAKVKFKFSADVTGSTFQCKLDDAAFTPCTSPFKLKVKRGKHTFDVEATSAAGVTDQSPATDDFKVKRKK